MRQRRLFLSISALCVFAGAAFAQAPGAAGQERPAIEQWKARSDEAQERLREGDFKRAYGIADMLVREMIQWIESGPNAGPILGQTVLLRALAEAGLQRNRDAAWDWFASRAIDPGITEDQLSAYGQTGESLRTAIAAVPEAPPKDTKASRPVKVAGEAPDFPRGSADACRQGTIAVDGVIDEQGNVRRPILADSPGGPVLALATLEALKTWKFRPARLENQPVPVLYSLTVNFSVGNCRNPADIPQRRKGKGML